VSARNNPGAKRAARKLARAAKQNRQDALRTFEGQPVYPRVAKGDTSPLIRCDCRCCFAGKVIGVMPAGDGFPDVGLANCPNCGSTRGFQCEPEARAA
jgi:hypothetical protein